MPSIWHSAPLIRIALPLIVGAALGAIMIPSSFKGWFVSLAVLILLALSLALKTAWKYLRYRYLFGILISFAFVLAGLGLSLVQATKDLETLRVPEAACYEAIVETQAQLKTNSYSITLHIVAVMQDAEQWTPADFLVVGYLPKTSDPEKFRIGRSILFKNAISPHSKPINPGQFDYGEYLATLGIAGTVFLNDSIVHLSRPFKQEHSISDVFASIQLACIHTFENAGLAPRELGVASALILGQRSEVLKETRISFADAGVVHILAVSGLHVGIIYLVLLTIANFLFPHSKYKWFKFLSIILLLWLYAGITGFSPSVLRAATMFSFVALGKQIGKYGNLYNMLAASAIILVVANPAIIKELGFQLSYAAVIGIGYFFRPLNELFIFKSWWLDKGWSLLVVSFSAQLATFPLSLYYFGQFPNYFLISNLLVIPVATIALYLGLALLTFSWLPLVSHFLALALKWVLWGLNEGIQFIAAVPGGVSKGIPFTLLAVVVMYVAIFSVGRSLKNPRGWNLWLPLLAIFILCGMRSQRQIVQARKSQLCFLEGAESALMVFQAGKHAHVVSTTSLLGLSHRNRYFLDGFFKENGIGRVDYKSFKKFHTCAGEKLISNRVCFKGISVFQFVKDGPAYLASDFIYLDKNARFYNEIPVDFHSVYVVDIAMADWHRPELLAALQTKGLKVHDMASDGVLKIDL